MKAFHDYWTFSLIRGVLTLMAAVAVLVLPQVAGSVLSVPLPLALAMGCFALYSVLDGGATVLLAALLPEQVKRRRLLFGQAIVGTGTGIVVFLITLGAAPLTWAIWAVAARAATAAVCEWGIAKDTQRAYGLPPSYASAVVLAMAAMVLPVTVVLAAASVALALTVYLGLYGANEVVESGRLLFREYRQEHPAAVPVGLAEAAQALRPAAVALAGSCEACPAAEVCRDGSPGAHWEQVMKQPQPLIVRSVRLTALADSQPLRRTA